MLHLKKEKILLRFSEIIALLQQIKLPSVILHYISLVHLVAFVLLHYMKTPTNQSILRLSLLLSLRPNACMHEVFLQVLFSGLLCLAAFLLSFYICCGKPDITTGYHRMSLLLVHATTLLLTCPKKYFPFLSNHNANLICLEMILKSLLPALSTTQTPLHQYLISTCIHILCDFSLKLLRLF